MTTLSLDEYRARYQTPRTKYGNRRVTLDGVTFDSAAEAQRWQDLLLLAATGAITGLQRQPSFVLLDGFTDCHGKRQRKTVYIADFAYEEQGHSVVEDIKGGKATQTQVFRLKAKLFMAKYPHIDFRIIEA